VVARPLHAAAGCEMKRSYVIVILSSWICDGRQSVSTEVQPVVCNARASVGLLYFHLMFVCWKAVTLGHATVCMSANFMFILSRPSHASLVTRTCRAIGRWPLAPY